MASFIPSYYRNWQSLFFRPLTMELPYHWHHLALPFDHRQKACQTFEKLRQARLTCP